MSHPQRDSHADPARPGAEDSLDDLLDRLVAEYSDDLAAGRPVDPRALLGRVPPAARPGLERCLKTIDAGMARAPFAFQPLAAGVVLGRYRLNRELGRGGMAIVWLAHDEELRRAVALKILRPGLSLERRHVDRFRREALAIARLKHPNIVQIHDVGEALGHHYLAMEFVDGPSFATVLEALRDAPRRTSDELARAVGVASLAAPGESFERAVAKLLVPVAQALEVAHAHGLVHRDVKPSNLLLRADGTPVVCDFGLAKSEGDPALSLTGDPIGTPYYMSPEQAWLSEVAVDHRTDVYSLGVTLYEALSGRRPYEGSNVLEVFEAIKTRVPPGLRGVSPATKDAAAVVRKAMAREPGDRYASAGELASELEVLADGYPTRAAREAGGLLRRTWAEARLTAAGVPFEYRSRTKLLGLPLVHIYFGRRYPGQRARVAKGWLAIGDVALGAIAVGGLALGLFSTGGLSLGLLLSMGGLSAGLVSMGGMSVGWIASGGMAAGYLAFGGMALGYGAIGGFARGVHVGGGNAAGTYVYDHSIPGEAGRQFAAMVPHWIQSLLGAGG